MGSTSLPPPFLHTNMYTCTHTCTHTHTRTHTHTHIHTRTHALTHGYTCKSANTHLGAVRGRKTLDGGTQTQAILTDETATQSVECQSVEVQTDTVAVAAGMGSYASAVAGLNPATAAGMFPASLCSVYTTRLFHSSDVPLSLKHVVPTLHPFMYIAHPSLPPPTHLVSHSSSTHPHPPSYLTS